MSRSLGPCTWIPSCVRPAVYAVERRIGETHLREVVCEPHLVRAKEHEYEVVETVETS